VTSTLIIRFIAKNPSIREVPEGNVTAMCCVLDVVCVVYVVCVARIRTNNINSWAVSTNIDVWLQSFRITLTVIRWKLAFMDIMIRQRSDTQSFLILKEDVSYEQLWTAKPIPTHTNVILIPLLLQSVLYCHFSNCHQNSY